MARFLDFEVARLYPRRLVACPRRIIARPLCCRLVARPLSPIGCSPTLSPSLFSYKITPMSPFSYKIAPVSLFSYKITPASLFSYKISPASLFSNRMMMPGLEHTSRGRVKLCACSAQAPTAAAACMHACGVSASEMLGGNAVCC